MNTSILFDNAISLIEKIFSAIFSIFIGPVFPAISFIPASITTAVGLRFTTSGLNLINICGVV